MQTYRCVYIYVCMYIYIYIYIYIVCVCANVRDCIHKQCGINTRRALLCVDIHAGTHIHARTRTRTRTRTHTHRYIYIYIYIYATPLQNLCRSLFLYFLDKSCIPQPLKPKLMIASIAYYSLSKTTQTRSNLDNDAKYCPVFRLCDDTTTFKPK